MAAASGCCRWENVSFAQSARRLFWDRGTVLELFLDRGTVLELFLDRGTVLELHGTSAAAGMAAQLTWDYAELCNVSQMPDG